MTRAGTVIGRAGGFGDHGSQGRPGRERLWAKLKLGLKIAFFVGATLVSLGGVAELVIKANQFQAERTHQ